MKIKVGTYQIHGVNDKSQARVIPVGMVELEADERLNDTTIRVIEVKKNVTGVICGCNITDAYLMSTKKLPMFTAALIYELPGKTTILAKVYFFFTITQDVKSADELIENPLNGNFSVEIALDVNNIANKTVLVESLGVYPGIKDMVDYIINLIQSESMISLMNELIDVENKKIAEEHDYMYDGVIPTPTVDLSNYYSKPC